MRKKGGEEDEQHEMKQRAGGRRSNGHKISRAKRWGLERRKSKRKSMIVSKAESIWMLIESAQVDAYQDGLIV